MMTTAEKDALFPGCTCEDTGVSDDYGMTYLVTDSECPRHGDKVAVPDDENK